MQISQTLAPLVTPGLREALRFGGDRADWERLFDEAPLFRHDDAVLRALENEARREEHRREQERRHIWCAPVPCASVARPHIYRALYQKDVSGVAGASDVWCDADFVAVDGSSGKLQSWVDYIDPSHLISQTSAGLQSALPVVDAAMLNAKAAPFNANAQYGSNRAASLWSFVNTISHSFMVMKPAASGVGNLIETGASATNSLTSYLNAAQLNASCIRGGSANGVARSGAVSANVPTIIELRVKGSPEFYATASGATPATITTLNGTPGTTTTGLYIGNRSAGGLALTANVRSLSMFRRVLSAAELAIFRAFTLATAGAAP